MPVTLPPGAVTTTSAAPAAWAGAVTVSWPSLVTARSVAALPPTVTAVAREVRAPVIVSVLAPPSGPRVALTPVKVGAAT